VPAPGGASTTVEPSACAVASPCANFARVKRASCYKGEAIITPWRDAATPMGELGNVG
jgi:hypothetical protein